MKIGLVGHTVIDTVVDADGGESRRLGGSPLYGRRALVAAGAECVVVTRGADPGDAVVIPGGPAYDSRLDHRDGTRQVLAQFGLPFSAGDVHAYVLPAVAGCEWLHLGAQGGSDFPPDTIAALATAGHRLCLDGQGPARGTTRVLRGGSYLCHDSYCWRYRVDSRSASTPDSSTGRALPHTIGTSSPGNSYLLSSSRTSSSTSASRSGSSTLSTLLRKTTIFGTPTWRASSRGRRGPSRRRLRPRQRPQPIGSISRTDVHKLTQA